MSGDRISNVNGDPAVRAAAAAYARLNAQKMLAPGALASGAPKIEPAALGGMGNSHVAERPSVTYTPSEVLLPPAVFTDTSGAVFVRGGHREIVQYSPPPSTPLSRVADSLKG